MQRTDPQAFKCTTCGARYGEPDWGRLCLSERIEAPAVRRVLSNWPEGLCVEVRRCSRCGNTIAAKRHVVGAI